MRTLYIILTSVVLFCNLATLLVVTDYFKKGKKKMTNREWIRRKLLEDEITIKELYCNEKNKS